LLHAVLCAVASLDGRACSRVLVEVKATGLCLASVLGAEVVCLPERSSGLGELLTG
jgi:hypothetical protein